MESTTNFDLMLIERIQRGDQSSLEKLFERYRPKAYQYALHLTRRREDANDLLGEAYCRALGAIHRFHSRCSFTTWLFTILRNCFLDSAKKRKPTEVISLDQIVEGDSFTVYPQMIDKSVDIESDVLSSISTENLFRIIATVNKSACRLLRLYYADQYTYEEIAKVEGIPIGTVKSRLNRARREVRDKLSRLESYLQ